MTLAKALLEEVSRFFFLVKLFIWLIKFFVFKNGHIYIFHRASWKPKQNHFLCITPIFLPSVGCSGLISLGKQGLPWEHLLFQGGA